MRTKISAIDYYLPAEAVATSDMLAETRPARFNIRENLISRLIGIDEVRHSEPDTLPSTLAIHAAERMFHKSEIPPGDIDAVIFCGIDRDYVEPSTAHNVQKGLGIKRAVCKDVSNACLGFMSGLDDADSMIRTGKAGHVLVCTGERPSELTKRVIAQLHKETDESVFRNKLGALTVGDAGAAAIVSVSEDRSGFRGMNFASFGELAKLCYYYYDEQGNSRGQMLMKEISDAIFDAHKEMYPETLQTLGLRSDDIDCLITHQVGKRPWQRYSSLMGVNKELMTRTFDRLGNITSATFPVNYARALEQNRIKKGDFVFAAMAGSGLTVCQVGITV